LGKLFCPIRDLDLLTDQIFDQMLDDCGRLAWIDIQPEGLLTSLVRDAENSGKSHHLGLGSRQEGFAVLPEFEGLDIVRAQILKKANRIRTGKFDFSPM
jgi:hypothetical protein